jgi:hypothetical protein
VQLLDFRVSTRTVGLNGPSCRPDAAPRSYDADSLLHVIPHGRTIAAAMTPVRPTIERFPTQHGAAVLVALAESAGTSPREAGACTVAQPDGQLLVLRDAIAAAPSPEHAAIVASGTSNG